MEDCRIFSCRASNEFGANGHGVGCNGRLSATRCTVESNQGDGVHVNNVISITVHHEDHADVFFIIKRTSARQKIPDVYAQRQGSYTEAWRFDVAGVRVYAHQTAEELGIEEDSTIHCITADPSSESTAAQAAARSEPADDGGNVSVELVDCVVRKSGQDGVYVSDNNVLLRGGTLSGNQQHGVLARGGSNVTVVESSEGRPQTVSDGNGGACYDITYDDDDTATEVLRSKIRTDAEERAAVGATAEELAAAGQEARPPLRVGQAVTARFADDDEQFYGGRVTAVKWRGHEEWTTEADHGTLSEAGLDRPRRPRGKIEGLAEGITVNEAQ